MVRIGTVCKVSLKVEQPACVAHAGHIVLFPPGTHTMSLPIRRRAPLRSLPVQRRTSRGQALVELALILPVLLVLFASALDLGRLFYSQITVTNAAREGAIEAARSASSFQANQPCNATTNRVVCAAVTEAAGGFVNVAPTDVSLTCSTSPCPPATPVMGNTVSVRVQGHFSLLTPLLSVFFGGQSITFASTATAQLRIPPP